MIEQPYIVCPKCGMVSHNPNDVRERYCGNCHSFHDQMAIYAWVGVDELGSGRVGLKQGVVPAGTIPLVAMSYHLDKLARLKPQMEAQARASGMKIRLCKFVMVEIAAETEAGE
jgi:hypothetical protein